MQFVGLRMLMHTLAEMSAGQLEASRKNVARIVPVEPSAAHDSELRDLERQGLVRLGTGKLPRGLWKLRRPRDAKGAVRRAVTEERDGG